MCKLWLLKSNIVSYIIMHVFQCTVKANITFITLRLYLQTFIDFSLDTMSVTIRKPG